MTRSQAAFTLAHAVTRRSVDEHGGDYRATFGSVLREMNSQLALNADCCIGVFLDESAHEDFFLDVDYEFTACAIWALEGDIHCAAAA